jgi:hypothetical protein
MTSVEPNLTRSVKWAKAALMDRRHEQSYESYRQVRHHDWRGLMSTLEVEMDLNDNSAATAAVRMIDCGRATERTCGFAFIILFELGAPPNDGLLLL